MGHASSLFGEWEHWHLERTGLPKATHAVNERALTESNPFDSQYSELPAKRSQVLPHVSCVTLGKTLCLSGLALPLIKWVKL